MVSLKSSIIAATATSVAIAGPLESLIVNNISKNIVSGFNSNIIGTVARDVASSEANYLVNAIASDSELYPFFTTLAHYIQAGFNGQQFISVASQGVDAFVSFKSGSNYGDITSYFKDHITDFEPNGALLSASKNLGPTINLVLSRYNAASTTSGVPEALSAVLGQARQVFTDLGLHDTVTVISGW